MFDIIICNTCICKSIYLNIDLCYVFKWKKFNSTYYLHKKYPINNLLKITTKRLEIIIEFTFILSEIITLKICDFYELI